MLQEEIFFRFQTIFLLKMGLRMFEDNKKNQINRATEAQLKTRLPSEMASLSNCRWQNCKECPNQFINNGDMAETAKRYVVCE